jgi:hypothetical protein
LTRKEPQSIEELFDDLEQYIKSDEDQRRRVAERNQASQGNRGTGWRPQFKLHETSIIWKIPHRNSIKTTGQAQEGAFLQEEEEEEEASESSKS